MIHYLHLKKARPDFFRKKNTSPFPGDGTTTSIQNIQEANVEEENTVYIYKLHFTIYIYIFNFLQPPWLRSHISIITKPNVITPPEMLNKNSLKGASFIYESPCCNLATWWKECRITKGQAHLSSNARSLSGIREGGCCDIQIYL